MGDKRKTPDKVNYPRLKPQALNVLVYSQKTKAVSAGKKPPNGKEYQQGGQLGFWNDREYVLFRDGHVCRYCHGKSKDWILNVHHIESCRIGWNMPDNLVTLCRACYTAYHAGKVSLPKDIRRRASFRDASFMGIMRWTVYDRLKEMFPYVHMTCGYRTKHDRIRCGLEKSYITDARYISGNLLARLAEEYLIQKRVRRHNRKLHKLTISKDGYRKTNQTTRYVHGHRLFDKVRLGDQEGFIFGRRASGSFDVRTLVGGKLSADVSYKKLTLLERQTATLTTRRRAASSPCLKAGGSAV